MALHISFQGGKIRTWHMGKPSPFTNQSEMFIVTSLSVSGAELSHVKITFTDTKGNITIPFTNNKSRMRWVGTLAQTIVANIFD